MDVFNWGIIGPGNIAGDFVSDMKFVENSLHKPGAVLSHDLSKAAAFASESMVPQVYDHISDFIKGANIQAVYIATPHPLHYKQTLLCLAHGIPVLCEKPLGMNSKQVTEMISAAQWHQCFLMEGLWIRFLPSIEQVLSLIDNNRIGKIISIESTMSYVAPPNPEGRYFNPEKGGGSLMDLGIYNIYLSLLLLGKPVSIKTQSHLTPGGIDESCTIEMNYSGNVKAVLRSSLVEDLGNTAIIQGEWGRIIMERPWNEKPTAILLETPAGTEKFSCQWKGRGFQFEMEEMYNCLVQGKKMSSRLCHSTSLDLHQLLDEIRQQGGIHYRFD